MPASTILAIFDFDGTMLKGDSIIALLRYALRQGKLSPCHLLGALCAGLGYKLGLLRDDQAKSKALAFLPALGPLQQQQAFCRAFTQDVLLPAIYLKAKQRLAQHQQQGHMVLIVSASPDVYMQYLRQPLGVQDVLATLVDSQGICGTNCKGQQKVARIQAWLAARGLQADWNHCWGYGDTLSDLEYLKLCGHAVCVNPKPSLRRAAPRMPVAYWK